MGSPGTASVGFYSPAQTGGPSAIGIDPRTGFERRAPYYHPDVLQNPLNALSGLPQAFPGEKIRRLDVKDRLLRATQRLGEFTRPGALDTRTRQAYFRQIEDVGSGRQSARQFFASPLGRLVIGGPRENDPAGRIHYAIQGGNIDINGLGPVGRAIVENFGKVGGGSIPFELSRFISGNTPQERNLELESIERRASGYDFLLPIRRALGERVIDNPDILRNFIVPKPPNQRYPFESTSAPLERFFGSGRGIGQSFGPVPGIQFSGNLIKPRLLGFRVPGSHVRQYPFRQFRTFYQGGDIPNPLGQAPEPITSSPFERILPGGV